MQPSALQNNFEYEDLALGIRKYSRPENTKFIIDTVEDILSSTPGIGWSPSRSLHNGEYVVDTTFRYCVYFFLDTLSKPYSPEAMEKVYHIENLIHKETKPCLENYKDHYGINISLQEPYELLKYTENNHLGWHSDDGSVNKARVSMLFYLNDDYEGGELEFANFDLVYKPKAGDILIFPSSFIYKHRVRKIEGGVRYAIADFLN